MWDDTQQNRKAVRDRVRRCFQAMADFFSSDHNCSVTRVTEHIFSHGFVDRVCDNQFLFTWILNWFPCFDHCAGILRVIWFIALCEGSRQRVGVASKLVSHGPRISPLNAENLARSWCKDHGFARLQTQVWVPLTPASTYNRYRAHEDRFHAHIVTR